MLKDWISVDMGFIVFQSFNCIEVVVRIFKFEKMFTIIVGFVFR